MTDERVSTSPWRRQFGAVRSAVKNLQFRSSLALTLFMVGIVMFSNNAYRRMSSAVILETQTGRCRDVASVLAAAALEPLSLRDRKALEALSVSALRDADLLCIVFTDTTGRVLGTARKKTGAFPTQGDVNALVRSGEKLAKPIFQPAEGNRPAFLAFTYPVIASHSIGPDDSSSSQEELAGYLHLALGISSVREALGLVNQNLMAVAIILLGMVVPVSLLLVHWIVNPIRQLLVAVKRYGAGDLGVRVPFRRSDEIGQLGEAFNHLAGDLERSHNQLVKLNAELEHRVVERTEQLKELASRDALTGLYNRRHFAEGLNRSFAEALRYGADLSCLMIDLDNFKKVNDTYGHKVGDEMIVGAAQAISSELRASDFAARYGGDEFVALLPRSSLVESRALADRIRERFRITVRDSFPKMDVSLSIGIASLSSLSSNKPDALVVAADRALYNAKSNGKNRITLAEPVPVF